MWQGTPVNICTRVSGKDDMSAGDFRNGQVVSVWTDYRNDYGIYAQQINNDGSMGNPSSVPTVEALNVSVYPNPANDFLVMSYPSIEECTWQLIDLTGKSVLSGRMVQQERIDLRPLAKGTYIMQAQQGSSASRVRVVKY